MFLAINLEAGFAWNVAAGSIALRRTAPTVADLTLDVECLDRARELAALETSCCSFFSFDVREADGRVLMTVAVSAVHAPVLAGLVDSAVAASGAEVVA